MTWTLFHWGLFGGITAIILLLDLFVFHERDSVPTLKSSLLWTIFWVSLALCFNGLIWYWGGRQPALEFFTGYLVEWSLSMDNVFVFAVVFSFFKIPLENQYRVLFWGILGAVIMRLVFIFAGTELLKHFHWLMCVFGVFLIFSGNKLFTTKDEDLHPDQNWLMKLAKKYFRVKQEAEPHRFFVRENGQWYVTQLFLVLLVIESTDVMFAVDSVPAIFGITRDPFIVFTSNICAILGLRALYFLLAGVMGMFHYLSHGLSAILIFVGIKMNLEFFVEHEEGTHLISPGLSLMIISLILTAAIGASLIHNRRARRQVSAGRMDA